MKRTIGITACALAACAITASLGAVETYGEARFRPRLFKQFGDVVNLPDGLTQDKKGNIFMSAPNLIDKSYAGVVMKRCAKTGSGQLKRMKAYKSHILTKKSTKRKRNLRKAGLVHKTDHEHVAKMLPYA